VLAGAAAAARNCLAPRVHVVIALALLERAHAGDAVVVRQRERAVQRFGDAVDVVGIDAQRLVHRLRRAGHPREHEHARLRDLTRDELLRDQVHSVAQRRHERHVGVAVERGEALGAQRAVQVVDRRPARVAEAPVDASDQLVDLALEDPVVRYLVPARHRELHEHDAPAVLAVALEQALEGEQPLGMPLV
jgi:hypothetical protein